mmetsp:Transcript_11156/g.24548  ORF Transcript_11156/g.24548 Transcript_11156/m.24548 type:complete len:276 (+) Transcript_11156:180-1007(+)
MYPLHEIILFGSLLLLGLWQANTLNQFIFYLHHPPLDADHGNVFLVISSHQFPLAYCELFLFFYFHRFRFNGNNNSIVLLLLASILTVSIRLLSLGVLLLLLLWLLPMFHQHIKPRVILKHDFPPQHIVEHWRRHLDLMQFRNLKCWTTFSILGEEFVDGACDESQHGVVVAAFVKYFFFISNNGIQNGILLLHNNHIIIIIIIHDLIILLHPTNLLIILEILVHVHRHHDTIIRFPFDIHHWFSGTALKGCLHDYFFAEGLHGDFLLFVVQRGR